MIGYKGKDTSSPENLSSKSIVQLLDSFAHEGPNEIHQCPVFELLGPSVDGVLADYREGRDELEPETVLRMSGQLLEAVRLIHCAGMRHGGEIFFTSSIENLIYTHLYHRHKRSKHRI